MKRLNLLILFLAIISIHTFSQTGTISGKIIDKNTGESLVGATIIVTSANPVIGTVSDADGKFVLQNVPVGKQSIKINFISYKTLTIENIIVKAGKTTELNPQMSNSDKKIDAVTISANIIKNTENAMLHTQKTSINLLDGISAENLSKLGDNTAASALQRVTGVSIESGKYIFIRGLSDRYSKITLNGAEIPGLDPNRNTVQLDLFASNIIDNILVQKTYSPNLPASFGGGYVNIVTKNFPNSFNLQFSASTAYNPQANLRNDFLLYKGGKFDFLGIDDGTRAIPSLAQNGIPFLYQNNDELDKITRSFNKIWMPSQIYSFLNQSYSFSLGNKFKLGGREVGFIMNISYTNQYKSYKNEKYSRYNLVLDSTVTTGIMNPLIIEKGQYGEQKILNSILLGFSYKINNLNRINLTLLRNGSGLSSARKRQGSKPEDNLYMFENTIGYQQRNFISAQISGTHTFGQKENKITWISSVTKSKLLEPDLRFFNYDSTNAGTYEISYSMYPAPARFYRFLDEINADNKIDMTINTNKVKFNIGGNFTLKSRTNQSKKFDLLSQNLPFDGNIENYLSDENIGQNADATYGIYYQNDSLTDNFNSYVALEYFTGAYFISEFNLWKKLDAQLGFRYEFDYTFVENNLNPYQTKYVNAQKVYPFELLPALNLNYHISNSSYLRFAASRTLGRPAFREIAPYAYYDFKEAWRVVGNPDLKLTHIINLDLRWQKYMNNGQMFSVSGFVKIFDKPIELVDDPRANNPELHYVNADNSTLYGIETEIRKNLGFMGMKNLNFISNFTYIVSQVKYVENFGNQTTEDFVVHRPMYGQSPWVINAILNYNSQKLGLSTNLAFNVDGPKLAVVTKGETPDIYQRPSPMLNFNFSKRIGKNFFVGFSASNLLNTTFKKSYIYNNTEYIYQSYQLNRTFSFSLKYIIK